MIKQLLAALTLCCVVPLSAVPQDGFSIRDAMVRDLESVKYSMEIKYAPKDWKKDHLGWDLEAAFEEAKASIYNEEGCTSKDYQKIFKNFLKSSRDYHVNTMFYSTEWSVFPLEIKQVEGKYLISSLSREIVVSFAASLFLEDQDPIENPQKYERILSQLQLGDELIAIDGTPVPEAIERIIDRQFGGDRSLTGYALAEKSLFLRRGLFGEEVPSGTFEISVLHKGASKPATYRLPWLHFPEWIMNKSAKEWAGNPEKMHPAALLERYLKRDFAVHYAEALLDKKSLLSSGLQQSVKNSQEFEECEEDLRRKGTLPPLGEIVWETEYDNDLYAYLYKDQNGKKIGYLYLSTFSYGFDAEEALEEIMDALSIFERESEGLVLDITNNPGGNLFYMYAVLSLLSKQPLSVPVDQEILIQEDVFRAAVTSKLMQEFQKEEDNEETTLWGYPFNHEVCRGIIAYCQDIIRSWEAGQTLTDPMYLYGIKEIMPHPELHYTKPILLLINELDFSCADFFPAILQDNRRAALLGTRTAGAGGYVLGYPHASRFGVAGYTLTGSIAFRQNGDPIENLGITPDISCKLTKRDITHNYSDYVQTVNREVRKLIGN